MLKCVLLARLEAKPGDEEALAQAPVAQAPVAKVGELLAKPPSIEPINVLGLKNEAATRQRVRPLEIVQSATM